MFPLCRIRHELEPAVVYPVFEVLPARLSAFIASPARDEGIANFRRVGKRTDDIQITAGGMCAYLSFLAVIVPVREFNRPVVIEPGSICFSQPRIFN